MAKRFVGKGVLPIDIYGRKRAAKRRSPRAVRAAFRTLPGPGRSKRPYTKALHLVVLGQDAPGLRSGIKQPQAFLPNAGILFRLVRFRHVKWSCGKSDFAIERKSQRLEDSCAAFSHVFAESLLYELRIG